MKITLEQLRDLEDVLIDAMDTDDKTVTNVIEKMLETVLRPEIERVKVQVQ
jgi:hypothetical protein